MSYTVLARRYRSTTFDEVVGQEAIARTLKSAIEQNRVAHAYLFCGTRGVGKTTMARILARALNCEKGPTAEPCGTCDICQAIHRGDDVDVLEIDGASNTGVEDVRILRDNSHYRPARARFKIYYIDEVHMLSKNAFNALLKTLEEPPEHVKFIFSTTEPERLPATILSRCQRFDFRAVPTDRIAGHLKDICKREKVKAEPDAILAVARAGRGSVRDAMTLLDQVIAVGDGKVTLDAVRETVGAAAGDKVLAVLEACGAGDVGRALTLFGELLAGGSDLGSLLEQLMHQVRDLLVVKTCGPQAELLDAFGPDRDSLGAAAAWFSVPGLVAGLGYLAEAQNRARWAVDSRPIGELAVVRLASLAEMEPLPEVLARLDALQQSLASGGGGGTPRRAGAPKSGATGGLSAKSGAAGGLSASASAAPGAPSRDPAAAPPPHATIADEKKKSQVPVTPPTAADRPLPGRVGAPSLQKIEEAKKDPLVQHALRLFDGRIQDVKD
jgi:DNA polymerase-3 subunit gamma/tau